MPHNALPAADWIRAEYRSPDCTGTHPAKFECRSCLDTPWATPERCARASGLRRVCDAFDANMLVWPTRTSEYVFCPLPDTSFSGLHIAKAALEADAIIFAPHALPDVDCSESQFMLHMLMGLVKELYSLSIAQQHENITRHILSLLSTKLLVIDKQMETVCQIDLNLYYSIEQKSFFVSPLLFTISLMEGGLWRKNATVQFRRNFGNR